MINWFGPVAWGAPLCADAPRCEPPIESACTWCDEPITDTDCGVTMPAIGREGPGVVAFHIECHMRTIVGSIAHQRRRCACFGGTDDDPPGLTRRAAARAAVDEFERRMR